MNAAKPYFQSILPAGIPNPLQNLTIFASLHLGKSMPTITSFIESLIGTSFGELSGLYSNQRYSFSYFHAGSFRKKISLQFSK